MRYFVFTDKDKKITDLYRFNSEHWCEDRWDGKKWTPDEIGTVTKQLVTGSGDLEEVDLKTVRKWLPKALR
jgi:hypothetical protein